MTWLFGQARDGKMVRWREGLTLRRNCTQLSSDSVKLTYYLKIQTKLIIISEDFQCCDSSNGHPYFGLTDKTLVIPVSVVPARDPEGLSYTKF